MSVHFQEGEEWTPGRRYSFEASAATFEELTLSASVTGPENTSAERDFNLIELAKAQETA